MIIVSGDIDSVVSPNIVCRSVQSKHIMSDILRTGSVSCEDWNMVQITADILTGTS